MNLMQKTKVGKKKMLFYKKKIPWIKMYPIKMTKQVILIYSNNYYRKFSKK